ncbi:amidohydrolase family protein [Deinococcus altitudinis]|uniref:amidohydrolase family protein n=1 Tax=Deinococcus altitudinis TaxID=468914 RepID=UPI003891F56B
MERVSLPEGVTDAHLHFWSPARIDYFWLGPHFPSLDREIGLDELEPQRLEAGVSRGVFVQASHDPRELSWVLNELARFPWVCGVVGWLNLTSPDLKEQARTFMRDPRFKGVRHLTHDIPDQGWLGRDDVAAGLDTLSELGLSLDLVLRPEQLGLATEVVRQHPELNVVLDHLGNPPLASGDLSAWAPDVSALAALPNVSAKVSGLLTGLAPGQDEALLKEAVRTAFGCFGPGRLMFGGDWPVATQAASYEATLDTLARTLPPLSADETRAFWAGTARRVYRLETAQSTQPISTLEVRQ